MHSQGRQLDQSAIEFELAGRSLMHAAEIAKSSERKDAQASFNATGTTKPKGSHSLLPTLSPTKRVFVAHRIAAGHASSLGFYHAGPGSGAEELMPLHVGSGPLIRRHIFHRAGGDGGRLWAEDPAAARRQSRRTVEGVERVLHGRRRIPRYGHTDTTAQNLSVLQNADHR